MNEEIWKIPYSLVNNNWDLLQRYLEFKGNPEYILIGDVNLNYRIKLIDLGNLVGVDGDLLLFDCKNIKTLGKLKKVWGNINLGDSTIESLGELEEVVGNLYLDNCRNLKTLGNLKKVGFNLYLSDSSIESLGDLEYVEGYLRLVGCKNIKTLGKLKKVGSDLNLCGSHIESLGDLEFVGDVLLINRTKILPSELNNVDVVGKILK